MDFALRKCGKYQLFDIKKAFFDLNLLENILSVAKKGKIAINCENIECFKSSQALKLIAQNNIALYGMNSMLMVQVGLLTNGFFPNTYMSEEDFLQEKRVLKRRRFKVVQ